MYIYNGTNGEHESSYNCDYESSHNDVIIDIQNYIPPCKISWYSALRKMIISYFIDIHE